MRTAALTTCRSTPCVHAPKGPATQEGVEPGLSVACVPGHLGRGRTHALGGHTTHPVMESQGVGPSSDFPGRALRAPPARHCADERADRCGRGRGDGCGHRPGAGPVSGGPVVCFDVSADALAAPATWSKTGASASVGPSSSASSRPRRPIVALARLRFSPDREEVTDADVVVEAIPEKLDLKIRLFRDVGRRMPGRHDLGVQLERFPHRRPGCGDRPPRPGRSVGTGPRRRR